MLPELMHENFEEEGYHTMWAPPSTQVDGKAYVEYMASKEAAYVVFIVDFHEGTEWGMPNHDYADFVQKYKAPFYEQGVESVFCLHVIITAHPERVEALGIDTDTCWIVDDEALRLMVYENQKDEFINARKIVEDSLAGRSLKRERGYPWPIATTSLVLVNIIIFVLMNILGRNGNGNLWLRLGGMDVGRIVRDGEYYRFLTSFFLHFDYAHLFNNMLSLMAFGYYMEGVLGRVKFLILYFVTGIVAGLASFGYNLYGNVNVLSAGASGAIFGLMGGMLFFVFWRRGKIRDMSFGRMAFFMALSLYNGFVSPGVDAAAHMGGFLGGVACMVGMLAFARKKEEGVG